MCKLTLICNTANAFELPIIKNGSKYVNILRKVENEHSESECVRCFQKLWFK